MNELWILKNMMTQNPCLSNNYSCLKNKEIYKIDLFNRQYNNTFNESVESFPNLYTRSNCFLMQHLLSIFKTNNFNKTINIINPNIKKVKDNSS